MYIYNVTVNVEQGVHAEWLTWIESHIPEVLNTGKFISAKMTEVLVEEEMGSRTYSIQYTAKSREDLDEYYEKHASELRSNGVKKFADKVLAFRTELKIINEFYPTAVNN
ncbi:DUF4286 family protein [Tenacibaculum maritimum]|uniref:DUF4286 domain-containing protein n=1 Tax=Tenacibaculum maritimum NCIMB 2154 TaxID=1349785 RepID=A0A2H1E5U3_9FLAO|nr:DUF4286 family protein [Tenacibaculum maritimum]MCD9562240.1 DUF4286 family protein [Tenacibaculum maritimum]MCD9564613.1 DUF4286 family protein [Tenacibaculum maritimum]MCD9578343.1 DUF4286 family protein [Tenacibaculum maritimum]MCD9581307.1 DUF4286 family protein [Tenacibaculum maritimum]MCD9584145.1 DUF4286 family protein [Tenacibaculum maritimum]